MPDSMGCIEELPPAFGDIIDAHTHVDEVPALGWVDPPEKIIQLLDEAGITRAIAMTYTDTPQALDYLAAAVARFPDRLIGFVRLHPWYEGAADLFRVAIREHRFKGLKMHPVGTLDHPGSETTVRLLRLAAEHQAPVLFHCGDEPMTTPLAIAEGARQVPDATIILGHMGGYYHVDEAIRVAEQYENIVLETSATPYPAKIKEAVDRLGAHRVLYGSDGPGCPPRLELRKVLQAGLSQQDLSLVLRENVQRLLDGVVH